MRLPELRAELGDLMKAWEADGLDFRAPGGESPRDVQNRLKPFLAECARDQKNTVAVCHKGVLRALYALSVGWDMTDKAPEKLHDECVHYFRLDAVRRAAPPPAESPHDRIAIGVWRQLTLKWHGFFFTFNICWASATKCAPPRSHAQ